MNRLAFAIAFVAATTAAQAQIVFRAASSANAAGGVLPAFRAANSAVASGGTLTITKPSGTAGNDVLIASVGVAPSTVAITPPSGWTLVRRMDNPGPTSNSLAVYYKVAGGSEPASYAWSVSGASFAVGGVQGFTGVDTANPIHIENGQSTPSSTMHATPSITTTVANAMLVASHSFASSSSWTAPSGMTESFDRANGAANATGLTVEGSRVLLAVPGASGAKTATAAGNADAGNAHILALNPVNTSLSLPTPTGTAANDVMIAAIGFNNSGAAVTAPAGWTLVRRTNNGSTTSNSLTVYRRTAVAGEPASHSFSVAGGNFLVGGIQAFSGVDTTNPIDVENGQTTPSGTAHDTPSVTTTVANAMLVTAHTYASANTWTPAAGLTESYDRPSGANSATGQSITGTRALQANSGVTGAKRSTAGGGADVGVTHILALRPGSPNSPPTVSITSPSEGAVFNGPAITVNVAAADSDGTISRVDLQWNDQDVIDHGTMSLTQPPYIFNPPLNPQDLGAEYNTYFFSAKATDSAGGFSFSNLISVTVGPAIQLTSPAAGSTFAEGVNITLTAATSPAQANFQRIEFYQGAVLIGALNNVSQSPFTFTWQNVSEGTYSLTAKVIHTFGWSRTSQPVAVTVGAPNRTLNFIHVDHLNQPRLIADDQQRAVWRADHAEPFGDVVPDENPSGLGLFKFPVRGGGWQYADDETGEFWNWNRTYSPNTGRFDQFDPSGFRDGVNGYAYVANDPLSSIDPDGRAKVLVPGRSASFGISAVIPFFRGIAIAGGTGFTMRQCCGAAGKIVNELLWTARFGVGVGRSVTPSASGRGIIPLIQFGGLPKCSPPIEDKFLDSMDVTAGGISGRYGFSSASLNVGLSPGSTGASVVINLFERTVVIDQKETGECCKRK